MVQVPKINELLYLNSVQKFDIEIDDDLVVPQEILNYYKLVDSISLSQYLFSVIRKYRNMCYAKKLIELKHSEAWQEGKWPNQAVVAFYFNSFIISLRGSLDALAMWIKGLYNVDIPDSQTDFTKRVFRKKILGKNDQLHGIIEKYKEWLFKLRDYRDCIMHRTYSPVFPVVKKLPRDFEAWKKGLCVISHNLFGLDLLRILNKFRSNKKIIIPLNKFCNEYKKNVKSMIEEIMNEILTTEQFRERP